MEQKQNKKLSIDDIKKIIKDIEEEEKKNSSFNGKISPLTTVEYYKNSFKDKKFSLFRKIDDLNLPFTAAGFYDYEDSSIVIFLDYYTKIIDPNSQLFKLIKACYHEIRHNIQVSLSPYCFTKFACDMDLLHADFNYRDYNQRHDSFYHEIDANNYSVSKTKEYLQKKFPTIYEKNKKYIEHLEDAFCTDYMLFDIVNSIEYTTNILKKLKYSKEEKEQISPVLNIFFNEDNSYKSLKEIMENENFLNLDYKIIYAFLSCRSFLENLNFDTLDYSELDILNKSLEYTNELYTKQYKIMSLEEKDNKERLKSFLHEQKNIIKQFDYIRRYLCLTRDLKARQAKLYKKHNLHKKKIPDYIDKINSMKNNGFVIVDIFYIISLIISLGVIGYILLF